MTVEQAIQKCVDKINLSNDEEGVEIYKYMYRYKVIRELPEAERERVYDDIASRLGFL